MSNFTCPDFSRASVLTLNVNLKHVMKKKLAVGAKHTLCLLPFDFNYPVIAYFKICDKNVRFLDMIGMNYNKKVFFNYLKTDWFITIMSDGSLTGNYRKKSHCKTFRCSYKYIFHISLGFFFYCFIQKVFNVLSSLSVETICSHLSLLNLLFVFYIRRDSWWFLNTLLQ